MKHGMIDLETFGTRPGCAIRSVAAVAFETSGQREREFSENVTDESCRAAGLHFDPRTIAWWAEQSPEAQQALTRNPQPIRDVLEQLITWWRDSRCEFVWSHGATFDVVILEAAMRAVGLEPPWKFWNVRDTRTLHAVAGLDVRTINRAGTHHNALDDCNFQVDCVAAAYAKLKESAW